MNKKLLFGIALLVVAFVVPQASASIDYSKYRFWGEKDGFGTWHTDGWGQIYYSDDTMDTVEADPTAGVNANPDGPFAPANGPHAGGDFNQEPVSNFTINLPNSPEPANFKIVEAWWWLNYDSAQDPSGRNLSVALKAPASVGGESTYINTLVAPTMIGEAYVDDLNNMALSPTGDLGGDPPYLHMDNEDEWLYNLFGTDGPDGGDRLPVYYAKWYVDPQVHNEWLVWQGENGFDWTACNGSQFYVESTCVPGLPAIALIGVPPVIGALFRKIRRR
jgi:hypothetical protein